MKTLLVACSLVTSLVLLSAPAGAEEPQEEESAQESSSSASRAESRMVTPDGDVFYNAPPPFDPSTVVRQSLVGTAVSLGSVVFGLFFMLDGGVGSAEQKLGYALVYSIPLSVPLVVNAVGRSQGYPDQHLGAYIGSLAGGLLSGAVLAMGVLTGDDTFLTVGGLGFLSLPVAGSIIGYHRQVEARTEVYDGSGEATLSIAPIADPDGIGTGVGLVWGGRF